VAETVPAIWHGAAVAEHNWAGNQTFRAAQVRQPHSIEHARELITGAPQVRILGSRHSFNDIADADTMINLDRLPEVFDYDPTTMTARVNAAMTYARFAELAHPHGIALHNLASLPHISIAGAVATATHGSGSTNGNLATAVRRLELITSTGELVAAQHGEPGFDGMVVGLGALGAVTSLSLAVEPAYRVAQWVFQDVPWAVLERAMADVFGCGYSVSGFTRYGTSVDQVWVKVRLGAEADGSDAALRVARHERRLTGLLGRRPAARQLHPLSDGDAESCTRQRGRPGLWSERLPHFRPDVTPSAGQEIQSELFIDIDDAVAALAAVRAIRSEIADVLLVGEIRTVAADSLWMSPQFGRASVGLHFTWRLDPIAVERAADVVADALSPYEPRPHWGKVFPDAMAVAGLYSRVDDYRDLAARLDPRGAFRNDWFARTLA
jgi:xylitol oxidase